MVIEVPDHGWNIGGNSKFEIRNSKSETPGYTVTKGFHRPYPSRSPSFVLPEPIPALTPRGSEFEK
jgi:hypothetical protein